MEIPKNKQFHDLTGQIFGRLTVIEFAGAKYPNNKSKMYQWKCKCECGKEKIIYGAGLKAETTTSCGCYHKEILKARILKRDTTKLIGKQFGKLTVIAYVEHKKSHPYWKCLCECGSTNITAQSSLIKGLTKSCGCRQGNFTHGLSGKPGYKKYLLDKDPVRKLRHYLGSFVAGTLKKRHSNKGKKSVWSYLPYTPDELKNHLESLFEDWMSWDNYGGKADDKRKTWHIDHIKPQMSFSFTSMDDVLFQECWSLSNLRPLEKIDNYSKGAK